MRDVRQAIAHQDNEPRLIREICETLTVSYIFHAAWIVLTPEHTDAQVFAVSGNDETGVVFAAYIKRGRMPECIGTLHDAQVFRDTPCSELHECPLIHECRAFAVAVAPLEFRDTRFGAIGLLVQPDIRRDADTRCLIVELVALISLALHNLKTEGTLRRYESAFDAIAERLAPFVNPKTEGPIQDRLASSFVGPDAGRTVYSKAGLIIDFRKRTVTLHGRELELPKNEYSLISYLAGNAGVVLDAREILRNVRGDDSREKLSVLRTTISRLRKKLGDDVKNPVFISGRYGMGYTMKVQ
jgi:hypothetical protein